MKTSKGTSPPDPLGRDALFASAFEFAAIGMALVSPEGRWIRVNRALCEILGYSEKELKSLSFQDLTAPEDLETDLGFVREMLEGRRETYQMEKRYRHAKGHLVWTLLSVSLARKPDGSPLYFISQVQDLTERKRTEAERDRFFEVSLDLLAVVGVDGYLRQVNPAWTHVLGWSHEELLARPVLDFVHPDDQAGIQRAREDLLAGHPVLELENRYRCKRGGYRWLSWRSFGLPDQGAIFAIARDVTAQKQVEEQRRRLTNRLREARDAAVAANRAKSEFLAMMSHEIRTPMNAVVGFGDLLRETPLTPEQADFVDSIQKAGLNLIEIINGILDLSKMEAGKQEIHIQPFDFRVVVDEVHALLSPLARARGLRFEKEVAADIPRHLEGDASAIKRVLTNLIGNAIKFTEKGSVRIEVTRSASEECPMLEILVSDTGVGIDDATLDRLFRPFVQGDSSLRRKFGGTGLGLSISRHLAEAMGGTLSARGRNDSPGAAFLFTLPLVESGESVVSLPARRIEPRDIPTGLRILLAEDNAVNRNLMTTLLKRLGCTCEAVTDGARALEKVRGTFYDVILMDVQMPGMDGWEATRAIRRHEQAHPGCGRSYIIGQTAYATSEDTARCREAGMDVHLGKPITLTRLAEALSRVPRPPADPAPGGTRQDEHVVSV